MTLFLAFFMFFIKGSDDKTTQFFIDNKVDLNCRDKNGDDIITLASNLSPYREYEYSGGRDNNNNTRKVIFGINKNQLLNTFPQIL